MNLIRAETKANYLLKELEPFCNRIEIVGKIRRRKSDIDSIDILLAPKGARLFDLMGKIINIGCQDGMKVSNKKVVILKDELESITANLWFTSIDNFGVMFFIKTGGNKSVKRIETLCKGKEWQFSVSEGVIFNEFGKKLLIKEEKDIFELLGIPYIEPSWRE